MNPLLDALNTVFAWDLPDECLADALNDQARMLEGQDPEDTWDCPSDTPFPAHH